MINCKTKKIIGISVIAIICGLVLSAIAYDVYKHGIKQLLILMGLWMCAYLVIKFFVWCFTCKNEDK